MTPQQQVWRSVVFVFFCCLYTFEESVTIYFNCIGFSCNTVHPWNFQRSVFVDSNFSLPLHRPSGEWGGGGGGWWTLPLNPTLRLHFPCGLLTVSKRIDEAKEEHTLYHSGGPCPFHTSANGSPGGGCGPIGARDPPPSAALVLSLGVLTPPLLHKFRGCVVFLCVWGTGEMAERFRRWPPGSPHGSRPRLCVRAAEELCVSTTPPPLFFFFWWILLGSIFTCVFLSWSHFGEWTPFVIYPACSIPATGNQCGDEAALCPRVAALTAGHSPGCCPPSGAFLQTRRIMRPGQMFAAGWASASQLYNNPVYTQTHTHTHSTHTHTHTHTHSPDLNIWFTTHFVLQLQLDIHL